MDDHRTDEAGWFAPSASSSRGKWGAILTVCVVFLILSFLAVLFSWGGEDSPPEPRLITIISGQGAAVRSSERAGFAASQSPISSGDIGASFLTEKSNDEMIGFKITNPRDSLKLAGFEDGDILTYIGDEAMNAGQTPDQIRQLLVTGTKISVGRAGREVEWLLP